AGDVTTETSGQPGFGIAVALIAILIAGLLAWRRDHGTE
ncbi:MAG: PGF-CTERM sorting domain-containing protein, partial [Halobacteriales archaeon]